MDASSGAPQAISRNDAISMLSQMDEMRARLYALHPDLNHARQSQGMDFAFLPGAVDQSDAGQLSGSNPRTLSHESSGSKFYVNQKALSPQEYHPSSPQGPSITPSYQPASAIGTVTPKEMPRVPVSEDPIDVLSESESRAIKELIRSQLNAAHEAEAIKELIRTEVQKHSGGGKGFRLPPLIDENQAPPPPQNMKLLAKGMDTPNQNSVADAVQTEDSEGDDAEGNGMNRTSSAPDGSCSFRKKNGVHPERRKRSMEAIDDHTGALYPATAVAPGGGHHEGEVSDDGWGSAAENAYGAFIHTTLQTGLGAAMYKCGPMLVTSVLIQFVFSYELFRALPTVQGAPMFCQIPWDLQMAAVGVFVTLMLDNISGMYLATRISLASKLWRSETEEDADPKEVVCGRLSRAVLFLLAVVTEIATWFGIFSSGILFILTAESVDLVIRSTVAIMFVQNVDEIIFESCCSRQVKESLRGTQYKLIDPLTKYGVKKSRAEAMDHYYSLFLHLPVIFLISGGIVLGLRADDEIDCLRSS